MAYFHDKWVRNRCGRQRRAMRRLIGESIEEMLRVGQEWPDAITINWPPRKKDSWKSKSLPVIWIDADREDILQALDSCEVDEHYFRLLTFMLREKIYGKRIGHTKETEDFFKLEIRGNLIRLLRYGSWVDQPENLGLQNLNSRLEKFDLGRRSDLNFSSQQSEIQKYDQDLRQDILAKEEIGPDWEALYRDGSVELRNEILATRPWMKRILIDQYGIPDA